MSDVIVQVTNPKNNRKINLACRSAEVMSMTIESARKKGHDFKIILPSGNEYNSNTIDWALDVLFNLETA